MKMNALGGLAGFLKPLGRLAVSVSCVVLVGCGKKAVAPEPLPAAPPPEVEEMFPRDRSVRTFYGTEIWARFAEPLDSTTVDSRTVFLKIDALRVPAAVRWDGATRRIVITPQGPLTLSRTHTVRISTAIRTARGVPLEREVRWQFTTTSLRLPLPRSPADGATDRGPWTGLGWDGTEVTAGSIAYEVYVGPDSAAVAARAVPILPSFRARLAPAVAWPLGTTLYWMVTAVNHSTGERVDGDVHRFTTLPEGTPIDSTMVPLFEWGAFTPEAPNNHPCFLNDLPSGPQYNTAIRYDLRRLAPGLPLAAARIDANTTIFSTLPGGVRIWRAIHAWLPCLVGFPGPPDADVARGPLALGAALGSNRMRFAGATFTSFVQEAVEGDTLEFVLSADRTVVYTNLTGAPSQSPLLRLSYYVLPAAQAAPARRHPAR